MTEITMTLGRAEQLRNLLTSGISLVKVIREVMDEGEYSDALMGAMVVLQHANTIIDDAIEEAMHE